LAFVRNEDHAAFKKVALAVFRATLAAQHGRGVDRKGAYEAVVRSARTESRSAEYARRAAGFAVRTAIDKDAYVSARHAAIDDGAFAGHAALVAVDEAAYTFACAAVDDAARAAAFAAQAAADIWGALQQDCLLYEREPGSILRSHLWADESGWFHQALTEWNRLLSGFPDEWGVLIEWYDQVRVDATHDPFLNPQLDVLANKPPEFWGDGNGNSRTPDIVMADIAEILRGDGENQLDESLLVQSPDAEQFTTSIPIERALDPARPVVVNDQSYRHRALCERAHKILDDCISADGTVPQSLVVTRRQASMYLDELGETLRDVHMLGVRTEGRTLLAILAADDRIRTLPEVDQDFERALLPIQVAESLRDISELHREFLENDERGREIVNLPDDPAPSPDQMQKNAAVREALSVARDAPEIISEDAVLVLTQRVDQADAASLEDHRSVGRPFSDMHGAFENAGKAIAEGMVKELEAQGAIVRSKGKLLRNGVLTGVAAAAGTAVFNLGYALLSKLAEALGSDALAKLARFLFEILSK